MNKTNLGTEVSFNSAKMYSNSFYKDKKNKKKNTFQQSTELAPTDENVWGKPRLALQAFQAPFVEKDQEDQALAAREQKYGRRLNWQNDKIVEMKLQLGHLKEGTRNSRISAYISIKTEDDTRYMIFMRSKLTSALDETYRSIKKDNDIVLKSEADKIKDLYKDYGLHMGRVKYKPTKGSKMLPHHRKNLPVTLLSLWTSDKIYVNLYLLDRDYLFVLDEEISTSQEKFYSAQGTWTDEEEQTQLTISEAFGD